MGIAASEPVCLTLNENPLAGTLHPVSRQGFGRLLLNPKTGTTSFLHPTEELGQVGWVGEGKGLLPFPWRAGLRRQLPSCGHCDLGRKKKHSASPRGMLCLSLIFLSASRPEVFFGIKVRRAAENFWGRFLSDEFLLIFQREPQKRKVLRAF